MSHILKKLITEALDSMKSLANLHKPELKSTEDMPHYNVACAQIIKTKRMINNGEDCSDVLPLVDNFLKKSGAELKSELPHMIAEKDLPKAKQFYEVIINKMNQIKEHLKAELSPKTQLR